LAISCSKSLVAFTATSSASTLLDSSGACKVFTKSGCSHCDSDCEQCSPRQSCAYTATESRCTLTM
jgi:hypothetical protein